MLVALQAASVSTGASSGSPMLSTASPAHKQLEQLLKAAPASRLSASAWKTPLPACSNGRAALIHLTALAQLPSLSVKALNSPSCGGSGSGGESSSSPSIPPTLEAASPVLLRSFLQASMPAKNIPAPSASRHAHAGVVPPSRAPSPTAEELNTAAAPSVPSVRGDTTATPSKCDTHGHTHTHTAAAAAGVTLQALL